MESNIAADRPPSPVKVSDAPKFELETYISNYVGRTRFDRLLFIGTCSTVLALEALRAAVVEAKSGNDIGRYESAIQRLRRHLRPSDPEGSLDREWMEKKERQMKAETDRLERELKGYKNNMIKESIRMGNEELGQHYYEIGELNSATKAYGRMRDFCTTPAHIASMCLRIIQVAIHRGDWLAVQSNVHKARNLQLRNEEAQKIQAKSMAAMGLSQLGTSAFKDAAISFLAIDPAFADSYNVVMTSNDVAVYGGLCALASMDRDELQSLVLESISFRSFLELEPHIRRAISFFCSSKYTACLEILEAYRTDYLLDLYLHQHVSTIYNRVRSKAIVQYFAPFSRVTLDSMSQTFASPQPIEEELVDMIKAGTLKARIDLEKRVLVSEERNLRLEVHQEAQAALKAFTREAHLRLLRMNAINAGLEVKAPSKQIGTNSGMGAGDLFSSNARDVRPPGKMPMGNRF